jgi:hypothetical protein
LRTRLNRWERLEDRATPAVTAVSVNFTGSATGNGASGDPQFSLVGPIISDDGRFQVFASRAGDLAGPGSVTSSIFIYHRDNLTGVTKAISGPPSTGSHTSISGDGRFVTAIEGNSVLLADTQAGTAQTFGTDVGGGGVGGVARVSPDGRYVAYFSFQQNPSTAIHTQPGGLNEELYLFDRTSGETVMVSTRADGTQDANGITSTNFLFSGDSKTLFFGHSGNDLVAGISDTNDDTDIFAYDLASKARSYVSVNAAGTATGNDDALVLSSSTDGSRVLLRSLATDLDPTAPAGGSGLYVRDRTANTTTLVNTNAERTTFSGDRGTISANGRYVVFQGGGDILPGLMAAGNVFRRDLQTGAIEQVNVTPVGSPSDDIAVLSASQIQFVNPQAVSADGRFVTFLSFTNDLVTGFQEVPSGLTENQVYVRDMLAGVTTLLSPAVGTTLAASNDQARTPHISLDGKIVSFVSNATDLTALSDTNDTVDLFCADVPLPGLIGTFDFSTATATVAENAGTLALTLTRTGGTYGTIRIPLTITNGSALSGIDFTAPIEIVFANGATSATVALTIIDDTTFGPNGTFTVSLGTPTQGTLGALTSTAVTITENDTPPPPSAPGARQLLVTASNGTAQQFAFDTAGIAQPAGSFTPFPGFAGTVRGVSADVDGDGQGDQIYATGPGGGALVRIVSGATGADLLSTTTFDAYAGEDFTTIGLFLAAGDVNGDGKAEVAVAPDQGGGARVQVFSFGGGVLTQVANFFAIDDRDFRGGGRIALGDFNADGKTDMIAGAGFGGGPRIALFDGTDLTGNVQNPRKLVGDFLIFEPGLRDGVFVAAGDLDGDGKADLIFGGGPGGGPRVQVLRFAQVLANPAEAINNSLTNFFAFDANQRGGVRVSVKDADGDAQLDLIAGSGDNAPPGVNVYRATTLSASTPTPSQSLSPFGDPTLANGVFVG